MLTFKLDDLFALKNTTSRMTSVFKNVLMLKICYRNCCLRVENLDVISALAYKSQVITLTQNQQANTHWEYSVYIKNIRSSQFSSFFLIYSDKTFLQLQSISLPGTRSNVYLISRWRILTQPSYIEPARLQFLKMFCSVKL